MLSVDAVRHSLNETRRLLAALVEVAETAEANALAALPVLVVVGPNPADREFVLARTVATLVSARLGLRLGWVLNFPFSAATLPSVGSRWSTIAFST